MQTTLLHPAARVLVVDDDEGIQTLMKAIFGRHDVVVEPAIDGAAALSLLRHQQYDAILLDLMLPGTNGFEVIRDLKHRRPDLLRRTIVLTAASDRTLNDFEDGRLVKRVMRKPFEVDDLVNEVLSCRPQAHATARTSLGKSEAQ